jgi:hypothetical protein
VKLVYRKKNVASEEEGVHGGNIHITTDLVKRREFNLPTFSVFVGYEKSYDNLNREKLWQILREEDIPTRL